MDEQTRKQINEALSALNDGLKSVTPYKLALVDPGEIKHVDKNARYMSKGVFDQLTDNIKEDGNLSSLPFCWRKADGDYVSLSGNHRVDAAREAAIDQILILYTDEEMNRGQQIAVQLSHNSLAGADNPTTLVELWKEIDDLQYKLYSGLDDEYLETIEPVALIIPQDAPLQFQEMSLYFLPTEIGYIEDVIEKLGKTNKARFATTYADFDKFFEALLGFKEAAGILNTSTAFAVLVEISNEWIEHNAGKQDEQEK